MPAFKKFLHPDTLDRVARLELRAQSIVEGLLSGMHRSPYFGQSLEFRQHREYTPGDDLRHIDWKVWARQDRLYIKQYEEDTNLNVWFALDASSSMRYGQLDKTKFDCAATLTASLAYLVLQQNDRVGGAIFDTAVRRVIPLSSHRRQLHLLAEACESSKPREKTGLLAAVQQVARQVPRRGMIVLVSDLFVEEQQLDRSLAYLRQMGHDVLVFQVLHADELDFPFQGPTRFEGLESEEHLNCNPRALRDGYLTAVEQFLKITRRICGRYRTDYQLVRTDQSTEQVLVKCLGRRAEREQRR
ncbi:MAG: DUF58 domain-containing protein [Planctomycetota bacterium]|nr:DUF58 domain-containing protein [Planctomycetota bacterium]